jgi:hypothetical protein
MFDLIRNLIVLCILVPVIDNLTTWLEEGMKRIPWLPNRFDRLAAYPLVSGLALLLCWQGRFDFFTAFGFSFPPWEGWLATALLVGAGSKYSTQAFSELNGIAQILATFLAATLALLSGMVPKTVKKGDD